MINCLSHYFLLFFRFLFIGCKLSYISKANLTFLIEMGEFTIASQFIEEKLLDVASGRSEPVDFQRGELEWKGANIYFGDWTYKMRVTYK
jgi:hypothetical protein